MKVVKCMQSMCTILQAVSENFCAFSHVFFTRRFHASSSHVITLQCGKVPHKKHVCNAVKWLITRIDNQTKAYINYAVSG